MTTARRSRNQKRAFFLEKYCSWLPVIPEIPPSPPFYKGGLGGISETSYLKQVFFIKFRDFEH
jgi:hypothetical protein